MAIPKIVERQLYALVKAYEDWLDDKGDLADADLISAVADFCLMVRDVIPSTSRVLARHGLGRKAPRIICQSTEDAARALADPPAGRQGGN